MGSRLHGASGIALTLALLTAGPLLAQQTGTLTGIVTSRGTGSPLPDVQVSIQGTGLGGLSNQDGRFLIINVPAGEQTITAQLIGYGTISQTVNITTGEPVVFDFTLSVRAVQLDGMVVTGTATGAERREVGNSIDLITAEQIEALPVTNVEDILRGRTLGVTVSGQASQPGAGQRVLLRGVNSVEGRNEPLVFIDGVRMMSDAWEGSGGSMGGAESATGLAGIDPRDIERIEVIKGAAASTLYGTEAAAGVIQIFTKRGRPGSARWTANVDQTVTRVGHVGPEEDPTGLHMNDCTFGGPLRPDQSVPDPDCPSSGTWLKMGHGQKYDVNVRGGSEDITYFLSTGWNKEVGNMNVNNDGAQNFNLRGNFQFTTFQDLTVRLNTSYRRQHVQWIPMGGGLMEDNSNTARESLIQNIAWLDEGATPDNRDLLAMDKEMTQTVQQMNFSANISWLPMDNFRHRLNVGLDHSNSLYYTSRPWGYYDNPEGTRTRDEEIRRFLTLDYASSFSSGIPGLNRDFTSVLSAGGQYSAIEDQGMRVDVNTAVGPGNWETDDYDNITNYNEDYSGRHQGGFFLQGQFGWKNRLFLTAGLRADSHSNFGDELTHDYYFLWYPKIQTTYTLSDHAWWPDLWETARIRMAYGESGEPPPPGESLITWRTQQGDENTLVYQINNGGNTKIGPEITKEWEVGLDGSLFLGRVNYTATAYRRRTEDGLVYVWPPSSNGLEEQYLRNIGSWKAKGIETALDVLVFDNIDVQVNMNGRYQWNETRMGVLSNDPTDDYYVGWDQRFKPGVVMPAFLDWKLQNEDAVGELPVYSDTMEVYGPSYPPHEASLGFGVTLWNRLTFDTFFLAQWGHILTDLQASYMIQDDIGWPTSACIDARAARDAYDGGDDTALTGIKTKDLAMCTRGYREDWASPGDFIRLGTVTSSYRFPEEWISRLPGGFQQATVQLQAMNLWHWTDFPGMHPDALYGSAAWVDRAAGFVLPPPKRFTLNVRLNF